MSKDSEYIDFWLSSSNETWHVGSPRGSEFTPSPELLKSRKALVWHYVLAACALACIGTGIFYECYCGITGFKTILGETEHVSFYVFLFNTPAYWYAYTGFLVGLVFNYPTLAMKSNISKYMQFESDKLKEQTTVCRKVTRLWLTISCVEFATAILLGFPLWNAFFDSAYYVPDGFTVFLTMVCIVATAALVIYMFTANRNVDRLISENPTFRKYANCRGVDFDMLYDLFDNKGYDVRLYFTNGSWLAPLKHPAENRHGFTFVDTDGTRKDYTFQDYAPTLRELMRQGLSSMAQDINKDVSTSIARDVNE